MNVDGGGVAYIYFYIFIHLFIVMLNIPTDFKMSCQIILDEKLIQRSSDSDPWLDLSYCDNLITLDS